MVDTTISSRSISPNNVLTHKKKVATTHFPNSFEHGPRSIPDRKGRKKGFSAEINVRVRVDGSRLRNFHPRFLSERSLWTLSRVVLRVEPFLRTGSPKGSIHLVTPFIVCRLFCIMRLCNTSCTRITIVRAPRALIPL